MSFGFRDGGRPSLRDRFRGKSGDQILEELRKKLDEDKDMFFERVPNPPSFRRAGFPFDDDGVSSRSRPDFRHRLQELAQQHPEFADSLRPWYDQQQQQQPPPAAGTFRKRTDSNSSQPRPEQQQQHEEADGQQQQASEHQAQHADQPPRGIAHHGLRNTVDLGEAQAQAQAQAQATPQMESDERNKRAQSAPPTGPPAGPDQAGQRFVSRLDIQPQPGAAPSQDAAAAKPPPAPKAGGNVRQIPIFVEGRDEPVMAKDDVDGANFGQGFHHHPFSSHQGFSRPHMDSARFGDAPRSTSPRWQSRTATGAQSTPSFREQYDQEAPAQKRPFQQQHQPPPPTRQPQRPQQPQQQPPRQATPPQQQPPRQATPPREQTKPKDALEKVKEVRDEVESLAKQVDEFAGVRQDKQYLFLDEMLTRELIKLDVIETEGRDDVRAARKEAIRAIQQCISKLESKTATPAAQPPTAESNQQTEQAVKEEPMDVEEASSQTSEDVKTESEGAAVPAEVPSTTPVAAAEPQAASSQAPEGPNSSTDSQAMDTTVVSDATAPTPATGAAPENPSVTAS